MTEKETKMLLIFGMIIAAFRRGKKKVLPTSWGAELNNLVRVTRLDSIVSGIAGYIENFFIRMKTS